MRALRARAKSCAPAALSACRPETVYGLAGNALDGSVAKKIYAAKGRPSDNPLIVHIAAFSSLAKLVKAVPPAAEKLARAFWPGAFDDDPPEGRVHPRRGQCGGCRRWRSAFRPIGGAGRDQGRGAAACGAVGKPFRPPEPGRPRSMCCTIFRGKIEAVLDGGPCGVGG